MVISLSGEKKDKRNGHLVNEDIFYTDENITILMDGATGLGAVSYTHLTLPTKLEV